MFPAARLLTAGLALAATCHGYAAKTPSARDFARHPKFSEVVISPDGEFLAVSVVNELRRDLAVMRLDDLHLLASISPGDGEHVYNLRWVSDRRILVELASSGHFRAEPVPTGELMAIDRDGSKGRYLFGARGAHADGQYLADRTRRARFGSLVTPMLDDTEHALIASWSFQVPAEQRFALIERLDLYTGRSSNPIQAPVAGTAQLLADDTGAIRYAQGRTDTPGLLQTFLRHPETDSWTALHSDDPLADFVPLAMARDGRTAYLKVREGNDRFCLEQQDVVSGRRQRLACHPGADLSAVVLAPRSGRAVAAVFDPGRPQTHWLETGDPDEAILRSIWASFPDASLQLSSQSRDGRRLILRADSDTDPGAFYLFDRDKKELRFLMARRSWLPANQQPRRQVVRWQAADEREITGYLTVPRGAAPEKLPLIVMAHGGPFDVRDTWNWQAEPAFLATAGYLVLQPQFRGSSGFGREHRDAARQAVGTALVDDITAGVEHLIAEGMVDPDRVGIMGHSAGAHAALMSAIRAPNRYKAVVGISGGYDLLQQRRELIAQNDRMSLRFFDAFIGADPELLRAQSPTTLAKHAKAPVLLFHGKRDRTLPISQSQRMKQELERGHGDVRLVVFDEEAHVIFDEADRERLFSLTREFFDRHLRSRP